MLFCIWIKVPCLAIWRIKPTRNKSTIRLSPSPDIIRHLYPVISLHAAIDINVVRAASCDNKSSLHQWILSILIKVEPLAVRHVLPARVKSAVVIKPDPISISKIDPTAVNQTTILINVVLLVSVSHKTKGSVIAVVSIKVEPLAIWHVLPTCVQRAISCRPRPRIISLVDPGILCHSISLIKVIRLA